MGETDQNDNPRGPMSPEPKARETWSPEGWHFDLSQPWKVFIFYVICKKTKFEVKSSKRQTSIKK